MRKKDGIKFSLTGQLSSPVFSSWSASGVYLHQLQTEQARLTSNSPNSGFNFFGLSVTRSVSATSRSTIDTCRTLFIWLVSLILGWESFKWLQVIGFALLVYGTFLFNDIVRPPLKACLPRDLRDRQELLQEEPIEHMWMDFGVVVLVFFGYWFWTFMHGAVPSVFCLSW